MHAGEMRCGFIECEAMRDVRGEYMKGDNMCTKCRAERQNIRDSKRRNRRGKLVPISFPQVYLGHQAPFFSPKCNTARQCVPLHSPHVPFPPHREYGSQIQA